MARFLTIVLLLHVSLIVVALVDCLSADGRGLRVLPRGGWIFVILLASPLGAVAWLLLGKPLPAARPAVPPRRTESRRTEPRRAESHRGEPHRVERRRSMRPFGPEDDPAFIARLAATLRPPGAE